MTYNAFKVAVNDNERAEYPDVPYQAVIRDTFGSVLMIGVGATPERAIIAAFTDIENEKRA